MPTPIRQAAAIPVRDGRVCLVTSRSGRRWVFPKGRIDPGHTAEEAAMIEAWEEAGLRGRLRPGPVGAYTYTKYETPHEVAVYVLVVTDEKANWPERAVRRREWLAPEVAIERVEEPGLRDLLRAVFVPPRPAAE
jgi:8-oxo-dGTP pyrophosphatase MutT (NUDIX family)